MFSVFHGFNIFLVIKWHFLVAIAHTYLCYLGNACKVAFLWLLSLLDIFYDFLMSLYVSHMILCLNSLCLPLVWSFKIRQILVAKWTQLRKKRMSTLLRLDQQSFVVQKCTLHPPRVHIALLRHLSHSLFWNVPFEKENIPLSALLQLE